MDRGLARRRGECRREAVTLLKGLKVLRVLVLKVLNVPTVLGVR